MRWFSLGKIEVGVSWSHLVVAWVGRRFTRILLDWPI